MADLTKEMPLQTSKTLPEEDGRVRVVHGVAEVKTVLIDSTDGNGVRQTLLAYVAGDQVVFVPNKGTPAQNWMREAVLKKLGIAKSEGPESV